MASKESRLLREGKERSLIIETIKGKIGYRYVDQVLFRQKRERFLVDDESIKIIELHGFDLGEIKVKVVYQKYASEVKSEIYWVDLMELNEHPQQWL